MSFGKGSSKSNQQVNQNTSQQQSQQQSQEQYQGQTQEQQQGQTETPNNLPLLQQAWALISGLTGGTNGNSVPTANAGLQLVTNGANAASNAATSGLNAAAGVANNGATNAGNAYLTPFANGAFSGDNPYFKNLVDQISRTAQQSTDGDFAASGRYGSGANANAFNSAVANQAGQLGYQNYSDSLNRQLQAGQQLSTNSTNSTNAVLAALGILPQLGNAAVSAGTNLYGAGVAPVTTMAQLLQLLGEGGGTATANASGTGEGYGSANGQGSGTASGNMNGTSSGSSSQTSFGLNLGNLIQPFKLFG